MDSFEMTLLHRYFNLCVCLTVKRYMLKVPYRAKQCRTKFLSYTIFRHSAKISSLMSGTLLSDKVTRQDGNISSLIRTSNNYTANRQLTHSVYNVIFSIKGIKKTSQKLHKQNHIYLTQGSGNVVKKLSEEKCFEKVQVEIHINLHTTSQITVDFWEHPGLLRTLWRRVLLEEFK